MEDVFRDIERAALGWPEASRVFLADGDALALPTEHLVEILEKLKEAFPQLTRVSCYATPSNILRKSIEELELLRSHKLTLLYLGIETGDPKLLKRITKGATQRGIKESMHKARDAGLKVSATVILGVGGAQYWEQHIDGTLEVLNSAPLTYLSTLQLFLDPEVQHEFTQKFGEPFEWQDDFAILQEQKRLISGINPPQPVIFRSNHASNALALAGNLPRDRDRLLSDIDRVLEGEAGLRPHFMRRL